MGKTKQAQYKHKAELDTKLRLAAPTRDILEELAVMCAKEPSPQNTFQYAFCLSKSTQKSELRYAITILDGLLKDGYEHELDCMYGAATALYLLGEYDECRTRCENILRSKPENRLASELHLACIAAKEERDIENAKKVALGGAVAAAAVGVIGAVASAVLAKKH
mmetsp:Transcript_3648/g.5261  ORF Transcript_3648/g.5261 Transcript_3648/m.5261 type:complete len:165 (-) Transcript_3648:93-587(-)